jgi:hypothetical protein
MVQRQLIMKALSVAVDGESLSGFLPLPLAREVIAYIRDINIIRRMIPTFNQVSRTWTKPKKSSGGNAYYIPDGVTATLTGWSTEQLRWEAKKLMSFCMIDMEALEDSQPDVVQQILMDFAQAVAEAEEYALLQGDEDHLATAPTPDSATTVNWYARDPRKMFDGIFTIAGSVDAATTVNAAGATFDVDFVNEALFNLGKFGRIKSRIVGIMPCEQAANTRSNTAFRAANVTGLALSSYITGLGSAGEGDGLVTVIYGVPFYEAPFAPAGQIAMFHKASPEIGDRRQIKFRSEEVIESDQTKYVVSERLSFNANWRDAFVLIDNLSETVGNPS